jgi:hypothetical protein
VIDKYGERAVVNVAPALEGDGEGVDPALRGRSVGNLNKFSELYSDFI